MVFIVGFDNDGFHRARFGNFQKRCQFRNRFHAGRVHFLQGFPGVRALAGEDRRGCHFHVGGVVGIGAIGDGVFAGVGNDVKFVRTRAADAAVVGGHGAKLQPEAGEDARIGVIHVLIFALQVGVIGVEGIAVFHDKFAPAHDAEAGADFVAEFGLNLEKVARQLAIAFQLAPCNVGNHLFVRRANDEIAVVPVFQAQQLRPVERPAPRFLPQLAGLHRRHQQLDGAGAGHFLAHDGFHLAQHAQPHRHPRINARRHAANQPAAQHQLLADHFGIGRRFFQRRDKKTAGVHDGKTPANTGRKRGFYRTSCPRPKRQAASRRRIAMVFDNCYHFIRK